LPEVHYQSQANLIGSPPAATAASFNRRLKLTPPSRSFWKRSWNFPQPSPQDPAAEGGAA
ncbi:MAG: hypothetical protein L0387_35670, partial [Acidobacteria bacterium]|nr:hypothetical protein [Acidobacteriota bacterium]